MKGPSSDTHVQFPSHLEGFWVSEHSCTVVFLKTSPISNDGSGAGSGGGERILQDCPGFLPEREERGSL